MVSETVSHLGMSRHPVAVIRARRRARVHSERLLRRKKVLIGHGETAYLWDVETGKELRRFQGHAGHISSVAISPNGKQALTAAHRQSGLLTLAESVRLWDIATGREIRRFTSPEWAPDVWFSPDGDRIVMAEHGVSNGVTICDLKTPRRLFIPAPLWGYSFGYPSALYVSFSPGGRQLLQITDRQVKIWDARNAKELCAIERTTGFFTTAHFSPDGKQVLTACYESHLRRFGMSKQGGNCCN